MTNNHSTYCNRNSSNKSFDHVDFRWPSNDEDELISRLSLDRKCCRSSDRIYWNFLISPMNKLSMLMTDENKSKMDHLIHSLRSVRLWPLMKKYRHVSKQIEQFAFFFFRFAFVSNLSWRFQRFDFIATAFLFHLCSCSTVFRSNISGMIRVCRWFLSTLSCRSMSSMWIRGIFLFKTTTSTKIRTIFEHIVRIGM